MGLGAPPSMGAGAEWDLCGWREDMGLCGGEAAVRDAWGERGAERGEGGEEGCAV